MSRDPRNKIMKDFDGDKLVETIMADRIEAIMRKYRSAVVLGRR